MLTRLAPTPSGYIHTGNIFNFLLNWLWAKSNGGKVLLRIDDGDVGRKRKEYVEDIFRVLKWLGLDWDIGPESPDDFEKNWAQINRTSLYENILKSLAEKNMLFACNCSRNKICHCAVKQIPLDASGTAWKIKVEQYATVEINERLSGTVSVQVPEAFVVKKKDSFASYQICSLADDRHFGVTHICRGVDLLPSTAMQVYADTLLDKPYLNNCTFLHHQLIKNNEGNKLSKSAGVNSSSIIGQIKKEELLSSFAKWIGMEQTEGIKLEEIKGNIFFTNSI